MTTTETYGCDRHGEDAYQGCAMCDLETLRERLHEAELVAASWKREAELNEQAANESSGYAKRLAETEAMLARAGLCVQQHGIWCWHPADRHDERGIVTMSEQNTESVNYASYWLIETNDPVGTVLYCCGEGDWCSNPNHAMKWGSEEAARTSPTWTQMQYPGNMRIAEHQWLPKLAVWWRPVDELRDKTRKVLLRDGHGHEWVASLDTWSMNGTHPPVEWRPL